MKVDTSNKKILTPGRSSFRSKKNTDKFKEWFREEIRRKEGRCDECLRYMHVARPGERYHKSDLATVDHVIPLNQGGNSSYANLRIICSRCNYVKGLSEQKNKRVKSYKKFASLHPCKQGI